MSKVFFTSDLHIGHKKLSENLRGMDVEDNWDLIQYNWNHTVSKYDKVYILGDVTLHNPKLLYRLDELNGRKVVIGGNHDDERTCRELSNMNIPVMGCLEYKDYIITHIPVHLSELNRYKGNIHGHLHIIGDDSYNYNNEVTEDYRYINVNVEFNNYTPVLFTDILTEHEKLTKQK